MRFKLLLKRLLKQGFATSAEKENMWALYKELEAGEQETVAEDVEKADELPEEKVAEGDDEGGEEDPGEAVEKKLTKLFGDLEKKIGSDMTANVKKLIKEEMELNKKRVGAYNPEVQADEKRKAINTYLHKFINALVGEDMASLKEMTTDDTATPYSGYVVDSELSAEIRHLVTQYGVARREMFGVQLSKNSYKANNLATDVTVYWVDEGSALLSSQVVLGQETLELKKLGAIATLTNELMEDEEIDLFSFIASRVAEGFAKAEDDAFFKGDGTSTYGSFTGLLENSSINEVTMTGTGFSSLDADDLSDMVDATPSGALTNAKFYLHRTVMSYVRKLKDSNNDYIYQRPSESGPANLWGYPVVLVESMPTSSDSAAETSFVLFGNLKKATLFGYKGQIRASMFDAGIVRNLADNDDINLITSDRVAVRWVERVGYIVIVATAVTKLTTAAASA